MLRVFISSTSKDLVDHREAIRKAIMGLNMHPVMMEDFGAVDSAAVEKCRREVESCDIFVGIYAHRYGFVPPNETKSITELEYDWATTAKKHRLIYVVDPYYEWKGLREEDNSIAQTKLAEFKLRLGLERVWSQFTTSESLATAVTQGVAGLERPVTLGNQRRQLAMGLGAAAFVLISSIIVIATVFRQSLPQPAVTPTSTPIATAVTEGDNREVLVVLTKFKQVGAETFDPSEVWESTMDRPIRSLNTRIRVARYNQVVTSEEEAQTLARQFKATIVVWGWRIKQDADELLTTEYSFAPQWSQINTRLGEFIVESTPSKRVSITSRISRGDDNEYVLNFVLGQLAYFDVDKDRALPYLLKCIELGQSHTFEEQQALGLGSINYYVGWLKANHPHEIPNALTYLDTAAKLNPTLSDIYLLRAVIKLVAFIGQISLTTQGKLSPDLRLDALNDLNKALQVDPNYSLVYAARSIVNIMLLRPKDALEDSDNAIKAMPNFSYLYIARGLVRSIAGQTKAAIEDGEYALKIYPNDSIKLDNMPIIIYTFLGDAYSLNGDVSPQYDRAEHYYTLAISLNSSDQTTMAHAYQGRGKVYIQLVKPDKTDYIDKAIADCEKAVALNSKLEDAFLCLGAAYSLKFNFKVSIEKYSAAIAINPYNASAYAQRALAYLFSGNKQSSLADFQQSLKLDPNNPVTLLAYEQAQKLLGPGGFTGPTATPLTTDLAFPTAPGSGGQHPTSTPTP